MRHTRRAVRIAGTLAFAWTLGVLLGAAPAAAQQRASVAVAPVGWLGVQYTIERSFVATNRTPVSTHYIVSDVHRLGPAWAAGLRPGDRMLHIQGAGPGDTVFEELAGSLQAGDTVRISVRRGTRDLTIPVVATARPEQEGVTVQVGQLAGPEGLRGVLPEALPEGIRMRLSAADEPTGMTIVFRSESGQGFSYRIVSPQPGAPTLTGAFVVRTRVTDSLTALVDRTRQEMSRIERETGLARAALLRAATASAVEELDQNAAQLVSLREQRSVLSSRLMSLQDEIALLSRQSLGSLQRGGDVQVRVSPRLPLAPLIRMERRYLVGAEITAIDATIAEYFGVERGVLVTASPEGTPAAAAGLLAGDVIVRVGDRSVGDPVELSRVLRETRGSIVLTVARQGAEVEVELRGPTGR